MDKKRIHIIAIGGAAMHNIALDLHAQGHIVSGSDDEIYHPSLGRLQDAGIAPEQMGWFADKITGDLDFIILGMHAKIDNPELIRAQEAGIQIYSYPEFIYLHSQDKQRVVIAGSHGKTTTTAMIMHVLRKSGVDFDYLVGAQLDGFERMVRLSNAPLIIIEGDEYLSSPLDRIPKILHYHPHIAVITGIAWDHINVFPTFEVYKDQFRLFCDTILPDGTLIYYQEDKHLKDIVMESNFKGKCTPYDMLPTDMHHNIHWNGNTYSVQIIGNHNLQNMYAAKLVCNTLAIEDDVFFEAIKDFKGASKRLQKISDADHRQVYLDFAHAPSKVAATTQSFSTWFPDKPLLAVLELHTFSSLNEAFLNQYRDTLNNADAVAVYFDEHTLRMKHMPAISHEYIRQCFNHPRLQVFTDNSKLHDFIASQKDSHLLLMTSGNFSKMALDF